jgi:hypothetical protein
VRRASDRRGDERVRGGAAVGLDAASVWEEFAGVLEYDHAIAEETPSLLWMAGDDASGVSVDGVRIRTGGLVLTHF